MGSGWYRYVKMERFSTPLVVPSLQPAHNLLRSAAAPEFSLLNVVWHSVLVFTSTIMWKSPKIKGPNIDPEY